MDTAHCPRSYEYVAGDDGTIDVVVAWPEKHENKTQNKNETNRRGAGALAESQIFVLGKVLYDVRHSLLPAATRVVYKKISSGR